MQVPVLSSSDWTRRTAAALQWIRQSIAATGGRGSAHSYSPVWGWARAYPETTGYLIPTLLRYAEINRDDSLRQLARGCADWLCTVQLPGGAFPGGLAGETAPSVFNTSQILFGFDKIDEKTLAEENKSISTVCQTALYTATRWLLDGLEADGAWRQAAYRPGFVPSYYTRAVWGVLAANRRLQWPEVPGAMRRALRYYAGRFRPDGTVADWGFRPGHTGFTHTIAYTLEGFLESALLLDERDIIEKVIHAANGLLTAHRLAGKTAGRYGAGWKGDYSFRCVTGNAQLSVFFYRLWQLTGDEPFLGASYTMLREILGCQIFGKNPATFGTLPGSAPFWGPYLRFRYPNWGVKFYLDALCNWNENTR